jgi:nitrite reductase (NADH) small subunit
MLSMTLEKITDEKITEPAHGHGTEISLGPVAQIPSGEGRVFPVNGTEVAVFHTRSGQVYAVQAECPHRQGPLADGLVGGTIVLCPFHSRKFDLTNGIGLQGDCNLQTYPVRMDGDGGMWLTVQET